MIGAQCHVGDGAEVGESTVLAARGRWPRAATSAQRGIVHRGAVIGADGFGFAPAEGRWEKIEQLGGVRIGDDVEIGANTCIDRGALDDTVIEDGVKLDNLVQIGHNVRIGAHTAMAGCVGVAGSAQHRRATARSAAAAIILGHLELADHVHISAATVVSRSILKPGQYSGCLPVRRQCLLGEERRHVAPAARAARPLARAGRKKTQMSRCDIHQILSGCRTAIRSCWSTACSSSSSGVRIKALKNVTINEPFFMGHFPARPVMPGVLMLEAMAQAAALLSFESTGHRAGRRHGGLLRRHRRRALQAPGGARATS